LVRSGDRRPASEIRKDGLGWLLSVVA
jgi:hypothetical protein